MLASTSGVLRKQLCGGTAAVFVPAHGCNELTSCCLLWMMLSCVCISSSASRMAVQQYDPLQGASGHWHHVPPQRFSAEQCAPLHFLLTLLCPFASLVHLRLGRSNTRSQPHPRSTIDIGATAAPEIAVWLAAASLFAAHLLSQQEHAATSLPAHVSPVRYNGKIAAGNVHNSSKPHDMRIHRIDRCPHCSRSCRAVVLRVLSMRRCIPTASSAAALTLAAAHPSPHSTHRQKAHRAWPRLAWWLLDMCIINAFQLWSKGQQHLGQLRFRKELMHQLLQQLPP